MTNFIIAYVVTALTFLVIDGLWLGVIAKNFYRDQLADLILEEFKLPLAAAFYIFYIIGIVVFAIKPALAGQNIMLAFGYGALFGFLAYGTYNFTNMATLKNWPVLMSMIDLAWGTTLTALSAAIGYGLTNLISKIF